MSRLPEHELHRLRLVAGEIVADLEAQGYVVGQAVALHPAFEDGRGPTSALERTLVRRGAASGARIAKMYPEPTHGGLDLVSVDGMTIRRYRLKTLTYRNGEPYLVCGEGSRLIAQEEEPSLYRTEKWVLACKTDGDHTIEKIVAAEIIGHEGDGPVHLLLGPLYDLDPIIGPDGFSPGDDDDLGDDFGRDDVNDDDDTGDGGRPEAI